MFMENNALIMELYRSVSWKHFPLNWNAGASGRTWFQVPPEAIVFVFIGKSCTYMQNLVCHGKQVHINKCCFQGFIKKQCHQQDQSSISSNNVLTFYNIINTII